MTHPMTPMPPRSLRADVLLGAALWTAGLFTVAGIVFTAMILRFPSWPRIFHGLFAHIWIGSAIAILCMIAGFTHVKHALAAIEHLRTRLAAVRDGHDRTVRGAYPAEVQPLVSDLNALLEHREQMVTRAVAKAGDLAHGLKTPLAVLAHEAERARTAGQHDLAAAVGEQVSRMKRQIDYHLAHARAAASGATPGAHCTVVDAADGLARTLARLHVGRGVSIAVKVAREHAVRAQREDVDEMLGNLLDNACKWAKTHVTISSAQVDGLVIISVDDDGPGIVPAMRDAVLQRGVRADEAAPGTGLGLSIVRDLADVYGGSIALATSPAGGLRAQLALPAC